MGRYSGKTCRLIIMMILTSAFFVVEIVVGYITNSTALIADSFHMLSDVVAIIVGFASVRISKWPSKRNTYGWVRAEILGALVNSVFLLALCFSITVEALKRMVQLEVVTQPKLLLITGLAGLLMNIFGLFLFWRHGHTHGGHGHFHGNRKRVLHHPREKGDKDIENGNGTKIIEGESLVSSEITPSSATLSDDKEIYVSQNANITIEIKKPKISSPNWLNMQGVLLHVLGDALGSLVVVISALIIWFVEGEWKFYVDPALSVIMVLIILTTTLPLSPLYCLSLKELKLDIDWCFMVDSKLQYLQHFIQQIHLQHNIFVKESAFILLQTVPSHVNVQNIIKDLEQMDGIYGVHECHIWQLAGNRIIASAHIRCHGIEEYMTLAAKIKKLFHKAGIHSTTIQPEFINWQDRHSKSQTCVLLCDVVGEQCKNDTCCGDRQALLNKSSLYVGKMSLAGTSPKRMLNKNNSCSITTENKNTFHNVRSLDMKFSPDGDEVVLAAIMLESY